VTARRVPRRPDHDRPPPERDLTPSPPGRFITLEGIDGACHRQIGLAGTGRADAEGEIVLVDVVEVLPLVRAPRADAAPLGLHHDIPGGAARLVRRGEAEFLHAEVDALRRHGLAGRQLEHPLQHRCGVVHGRCGAEDLQLVPAPAHLDAEALLDDVGITVNKNAIPFDQNPPNVASGIRIGTPATTTRGMGPDEMRTIGHLVVEAIRDRDEPAVHARIREDVRALVARFPVPGLPRDRA